MAAAFAASGGMACAPATFNVRAQRAFANEEAIPEVVVDRTKDILLVRPLLVGILTATPYSPGDDWVTMLGLHGDAADRLRKEVAASPPYQTGEHEIPAVKLYRLHLGKVAKYAGSQRKYPAVYPSVLDGLASLSPEAKGLKELFLAYDKASNDHGQALVAQAKLTEELVRKNVQLAPTVAEDPPELVRSKQATKVASDLATDTQSAFLASLDAAAKSDLTDPVRDRIARDALAVFSLALRTTLESRALAPVVQKQTARAIQFAERDLFTKDRSAEIERLGLAEVPLRIDEAEARAARDETTLEHVNTALASSLGVTRERTPGFYLRESIVDQVVGVKWDSLRAHAKLDGEVVFFNQVGTKGVSGDYTGRTRRLQYDVSPVAMVGGRLQVAFDWLHVQNAATLGGAFTTDRLAGAGGSITSSGSLGERIGVSGFASDVIDIGAGLLGVKTRFKNATFTAGEVSEVAVDPTTGGDTGVVAKAPLQLSYSQLDIAYDVAFLLPPETVGKYWIEEVVVGFRYMSYRLPRILYELKDVNPPGSENQNFRFDRESTAQKLTTETYMGGGTFRFGQGEGRLLSLFGDVGIYGGAGPSRYSFANGNVEKPIALVLNPSLGLGGRLRLTPRNSRFRLLLEAQYHGEGIYQAVLSEIRATETQDGTTYQVGKKVDFGGLDIFHGPRLQLVGVF